MTATEFTNRLPTVRAISRCRRNIESEQTVVLDRRLAVNCYVEPVYTIDVDLVVVAKNLAQISASPKRLVCCPAI